MPVLWGLHLILSRFVNYNNLIILHICNLYDYSNIFGKDFPYVPYVKDVNKTNNIS